MKKRFFMQLLGFAFGAHTCLLAHAAAANAKTLNSSLYQLNLALTDQDGQSSHWGDGSHAQKGARIVGMFYSRCDYVCPMLFEAIKNVEAQLPVAQRNRLHVSLITLDPERDSVAALHSTANQRAGEPARWRLYRSASTDVRSLAGLLGVRYRRLSNGEFNHSTLMILLDAHGVELARTANIASPDPGFLAAVRAATAEP